MSNIDPKEYPIVVENLVKSFDGRVVLDGINFTVKKGETVVIMGGSGCGKSTLLRHLIGAYLPDSGDIHVLGQNIVKCDRQTLDEIRKKFGILFQGGALYNSMTVGENVALPMREHTQLNDHIIKIMVKMKLEQVGLRDFDHLKPSQISGGMQKRVALARAIALDPEILFYDEPSAGLDPIVSSVIDQLIMDFADKLHVTSIVVTHHMESAFKIANKIVMLYQGKIIATGTPEEIQASDDPLVKQFVTGSPDGPIPLRMSSKDYVKDILEA